MPLELMVAADREDGDDSLADIYCVSGTGCYRYRYMYTYMWVKVSHRARALIIYIMLNFEFSPLLPP